MKSCSMSCFFTLIMNSPFASWVSRSAGRRMSRSQKGLCSSNWPNQLR